MLNRNTLCLIGYAVAAIMVLFIFLQWVHAGTKYNRSPMCTSLDHENSIYLLVRSYRDMEVGKTLTSAFANAKCPSRVYVGVVEHVESRAESALSLYVTESMANGHVPVMSNVRVHTYPTAQATGAMTALLDGLAMHDGQTFIMTVDAHTRFTPAWDVLCIAQHNAVEHGLKPPVLTTMPHQSNDITNMTVDAPPFIHPHAIDEHGTIIMASRALRESPEEALPVTSALWSGKLSFARAIPFIHAVAQVPVIENIRHELDGYLSIHLAKQFAFYAPGHNICYHNWRREQTPPMRAPRGPITPEYERFMLTSSARDFIGALRMDGVTPRDTPYAQTLKSIIGS